MGQGSKRVLRTELPAVPPLAKPSGKPVDKEASLHGAVLRGSLLNHNRKAEKDREWYWMERSKWKMTSISPS